VVAEDPAAITILSIVYAEVSAEGGDAFHSSRGQAKAAIGLSHEVAAVEVRREALLGNESSECLRVWLKVVE
jgi:hypothetical protein